MTDEKAKVKALPTLDELREALNKLKSTNARAEDKLLEAMRETVTSLLQDGSTKKEVREKLAELLNIELTIPRFNKLYDPEAKGRGKKRKGGCSQA